MHLKTTFYYKRQKREKKNWIINYWAINNTNLATVELEDILRCWDQNCCFGQSWTQVLALSWLWWEEDTDADDDDVDHMDRNDNHHSSYCSLEVHNGFEELSIWKQQLTKCAQSSSALWQNPFLVCHFLYDFVNFWKKCILPYCHLYCYSPSNDTAI